MNKACDRRLSSFAFCVVSSLSGRSVQARPDPPPFHNSNQDKKLKDNKSPGIGGITPKVLKEIAEEISVPLAIMFNLSLREGTVPHEWKHANVVPIFKNGNRCKAENYRPVSLTSVVCKLLESLLRDHMVDFLENHN